jgi:hypothetical protein
MPNSSTEMTELLQILNGVEQEPVDDQISALKEMGKLAEEMKAEPTPPVQESQSANPFAERIASAMLKHLRSLR